MHTLIKGSIFDTECDLIIVPCSTYGTINSAIINDLVANNLNPEKHKNQFRFEYGEVYFYEVENDNLSVTVGLAVTVDIVDISSIENLSEKKKNVLAK